MQGGCHESVDPVTNLVGISSLYAALYALWYLGSLLFQRRGKSPPPPHEPTQASTTRSYLEFPPRGMSRETILNLRTVGRAVYESVVPTLDGPERYERKKAAFLQLQSMVQDYWPCAQLRLYGSSATGFASSGSDLDIVCDWTGRRHPLDQREQRQRIRWLFKYLRPQFRELRDVSEARIPLLSNPAPAKSVVRSMDGSETECDFPDCIQDVPFDLTASLNGRQNTALLRRYVDQDPMLCTVMVSIKSWARKTGLNSTRNGYLSNYAWSLMLIYYLVRRELLNWVDPKDVREDELEPFPEAPPRPDIRSELWDLELAGFFWFYSEEFKWKESVVSLNVDPTRKRLTKQEVDPSAAPFCIEDPFETTPALPTGGSRTVNQAGQLSPNELDEVKSKLHATWKRFCEGAGADELGLLPTGPEAEEKTEYALRLSGMEPCHRYKVVRAVLGPRGETIWRIQKDVQAGSKTPRPHININDGNRNKRLQNFFDAEEIYIKCAGESDLKKTLKAVKDAMGDHWSLLPEEERLSLNIELEGS